MQKFIISEIDLNNDKLRLDSFLSVKLRSSKNQIQSLIKNKKVYLNGTLCTKNGILLKAKDCIELDIYKDSHIQGLDTKSQHNSNRYPT